MKVARGAVLGLLLFGSVAWAGPFQMSYSGLFPANRDGKSVQTYLLLLDQPRQVRFTLTDEKGNPQPNVRVIEVFTSGATGAIKNPDGITQADLTESGIYELRVSADAKAAGDLGFVLKVADTGVAPTVTSSASAPTTSGVPSPAPQANPQTTPEPTTPNSPPGIASPAPVALPGTAQSIVTNPTTLSVSPPSPSVPPVQPGAPAPPTAGPAPVPTAVPSSPAKSGEPVGAIVPPSTPPDTAPLVITRKYPHGSGYADPYKPVEVVFDRPIPGNPAPENVLQVGVLGPDGLWKAVQGQWFASGKNGVRFLPKRSLTGAIYHVRIIDPRNQGKIDEFTFATFPEVRLSLTRTTEGSQGDLDWSAATEVLPGPEGQVVRLDNSDLVLKADDKEITRVPFTPDMPPFGNRDEMRFQGRPFGFTIVLPASRISPDWKHLSLSLFTRIAGRDGSLEVARTTMTCTSAGVSIAATPSAPIADVPQATPSIAVVSATPASPIPANPPAPSGVPLPAESFTPPVGQGPVSPIPDPGPGATVLPENEFSAAENPESAHKCWPRGVTWGPDGALWVADSQNRRVLKFNDLGKLMLAFGTQEKGLGQLRLPIDLAFGPNEILVSDSAAHAIHLFDTKGTPIRSIGTWGTRAGQVDLPHGIDVADGQIWLAERGNNQIMRFGFDGVFLNAFGKKGTAPGSFENPVAVRVTGNTVWVMEPKKGRVQRFSREGKYQGGFIAGTIDAVGFDVDPWGCPWIADGEGHRVLRYDPNGKLLVNIESPLGPKPWNPTSVTVRSDGLVAVGDAGNRMIRLFRLKRP